MDFGVFYTILHILNVSISLTNLCIYSQLNKKDKININIFPLIMVNDCVCVIIFLRRGRNKVIFLVLICTGNTENTPKD